MGYGMSGYGTVWYRWILARSYGSICQSTEERSAAATYNSRGTSEAGSRSPCSGLRRTASGLQVLHNASGASLAAPHLLRRLSGLQVLHNVSGVSLAATHSAGAENVNIDLSPGAICCLAIVWRGGRNNLVRSIFLPWRGASDRTIAPLSRERPLA